MKYLNTISKDSFIAKATLLISLAIVVFYLLTEHTAHLVEYSNYIILFAFILMHVFMHKGHGGHKGCGGHDHGAQKHKVAENEIRSAQTATAVTGERNNCRSDIK